MDRKELEEKRDRAARMMRRSFRFIGMAAKQGMPEAMETYRKHMEFWTGIYDEAREELEKI